MTTTFDIAYVRKEEEPVLPPPRRAAGAVAWLRGSLFSSIGNTILTLIGVALLILVVPPIVRWAFIDAVWTGDNRDACTVPGAGACWAFVKAKFAQFMNATRLFRIVRGAPPCERTQCSAKAESTCETITPP